jgi:hypothetical protein
VKNIGVYNRTIGRRKSTVRDIQLKRPSVSELTQKLPKINEVRRGSTLCNFQFKNESKPILIDENKKINNQANGKKSIRFRN